MMKHDDIPGGHPMLGTSKDRCRMEADGLYLREHRDALGGHPKPRTPGEDDAGWRKVVGTYGAWRCSRRVLRTPRDDARRRDTFCT